MKKFLASAAIGLATVAIPATSFAAGTTTTPKVTHTYEVVSGNYTTKAKADARLARIEKDGLTGWKVVEKNKRFLDVWGPHSLAHCKTEQHIMKHFKMLSSIQQVS